MALSARRIAGIGRIWADGNLLRGSAGDFKTPTRFRLYLGADGQPVDPLIASAEGVAGTPAYRGLAYAVFEDFELGDYGNRIPSLSFELMADGGDIGVGAILGELGGEGVAADDEAEVSGFAAMGDSIRGAAETLGTLFRFAAVDDGATLRLITALPPYGSIDEEALGAAPGETGGARIARERRSASSEPATVSIAHYDPARDYLQGVQQAAAGNGNVRHLRIDLPVTLGSGRVKELAFAALQRTRVERETAKVRLPWRYVDLVPGRSLLLPGDNRPWRVAGVSCDRMMVEADLVRIAAPSAGAAVSDPGRPVLQADRVHGPTLLHLLDLPPLTSEIATVPRLAVAAAGASAGWRKASLLLTQDGGASWQEAGGTAAPATIGTTLTALPLGGAALLDRAAHLDIQLSNDAIDLADADMASLLSGANTAMIGQELIQFSTAMPLGGRAFRLTGFLRGRRGTEWAIASHVAGEAFTLIEAETLAMAELRPGTTTAGIMAIGVGDAVPVRCDLEFSGLALLPPSPVHLRAERQVNGDTAISWIRRSRAGWGWGDGMDAPLAEEFERYSMVFAPNAGPARVIECNAATMLYEQGDRLLDLAAGATAMDVSIRQYGTHGQSRAARMTFSLL